MNIDYTVMDKKVIGAAAKRLKLEAKGDIVAKANALSEHFKKQAAKKKTDLYSCTICGGLADDGWPKCPYCGGAMEDEEPNGKPKNAQGAFPAWPEPKQEIVTTAEVVITVGDLDASILQIAELKASASGSIWELGQAILHNYERELWKLRMKGTKVAYTNYKKFVGAELGMSHVMAYNLMNVARRFTRDDVAAVGPTKLSIIAKVEGEEKRAKLLDAAKNGTSSRELEAQVRGEPDPKEPVTFVARTDGSTALPMKRASDGEPATRVEAGVWAEEVHENGVTSAYSVEVEGDAVVLRVNRYRG